MKMLRASEVAEILQVTEARVYELARRNLLPHVRLGRQVRFSETALAEWAQRGDAATKAVNELTTNGKGRNGQNEDLAA